MDTNIESHLVETRVFEPPKSFAKKAEIKSLAKYRKMYRKSIENPDKFWAKEARELEWQERWTKVFTWRAPFAKWFVGGKLNVSENCLDRHLTGRNRNKAAIHLGRRAGRQAHAHLSAIASRSLPLRERAEAKQDSQRRSRHHLHADDSGSGHRDAGLRAHRRGAFGRLRRIQRGQHSRSHRRLRRDRRDHGGRRLSARRDRSVEEKCR